MEQRQDREIRSGDCSGKLSRERLNEIKDIRNRDNRFAAVNGILIKEIDEGYALVEMTVDKDKMNPMGTVQGGAIFTMCDNAGGTAASTLGNWVTTVDAGMHYLRPTIDKTLLRAESRVRKGGKNIIVCDVTVTDQDGLEVAMGTFTFMRLKKIFPEED